jgi:hypothetical protein
MSFDEAIRQQPEWVQIWLNIMAVVIIGTVVVLLFSRATRRDALIMLVANVANAFAVLWMFGELGYVRLLGLPHIIIWTPLVVYLWRRLGDPGIVAPFRQVILLFIATVIISLAFDYTDTARYLLGERAPLAAAAPAS